MKTFIRKIPIKHILKITALTIAGILVLLLVCLAFLPSLVSSHTVQARLQKSLSIAMKRQVAWYKLDPT